MNDSGMILNELDPDQGGEETVSGAQALQVPC